MGETSPGKAGQIGEEVVLPQGLGRDVDAQVLHTNLEDEVGGQQGSARVVEVEG